MNAIDAGITALYDLVDVPLPSDLRPITPLKSITDRLPLRCVELRSLTCAAALEYLMRLGAISSMPELGDSMQLTEALAGFAFQSGDCAFLFVRSEDPVVRRRFSIAHELGHYILHFRPIVAKWRQALANGEDLPETLVDAFTTKDIGESEELAMEADYDRRELEANTFAACLLMPSALVLSRANAFRASFPNDAAGLEDFLATEFLVSRAAIRRRLSDLEPVRTSQ